MSMLFSIVVFIALNIIPADISVFEIADPAGRTVNGKPVEKVIRFTKQDAGGWQVVDLPRDELGTYTLEGNKLTVAPPEDERKRGNTKSMATPMDSILDIPKELDWTSITKLELKRDGHASISRKPNQVSVEITMGSGERSRQQTFIIRWKDKDQE
jgi:hypothetical protein